MRGLVSALSRGKVCIIAEAGVNHNGDKDRAFELLRAAANAGADAFKVQIFSTENLVTRSAQKANYQAVQTGNTESQHDMLRKLELPLNVYLELSKECALLGLDFLVTPFDIPGIRYLTDELDLPILKLPSGEITNAHYLYHAARSGADLILSTGMSTLDEIRMSLGIIACAMAGDEPSHKRFNELANDPECLSELTNKVALLHCTTQYPTPFEDVNLRAMKTLEENFGLPVGLSDHSAGISVPIAAVALGATFVEKHFTLSRDLPGPDHQASLEPDELARMIRYIRNIENAMGDGRKIVQPSEAENIPIARRSIYATGAIRAGEMFTEQNITTKRPGTALSAAFFWDVVGMYATQNYDRDDPINEKLELERKI